MFDFLLSKEEKDRRLYLTNYKIAFDLIPVLCKKVCEEDENVDILYTPSSWKKQLSETLGKNYYGGQMPKALHSTRKDGEDGFLIVIVTYTMVGMMSEPACTMAVIDVNRKEYRIFCLERFMGNSFYLCGVDKGLHTNYGIEYDGLKVQEFLRTAENLAIESLRGGDVPTPTIESSGFEIKVNATRKKPQELISKLDLLQLGVMETWDLLDFCSFYGSPRYVEDFKDKDGNFFTALSFISDKFDKAEEGTMKDSDTSYAVVRFSESTGVMSIDDIKKKKKQLHVLKFRNPTDKMHHYCLWDLSVMGLV